MACGLGAGSRCVVSFRLAELFELLQLVLLACCEVADMTSRKLDIVSRPALPIYQPSRVDRGFSSSLPEMSSLS